MLLCFPQILISICFIVNNMKGNELYFLIKYFHYFRWSELWFCACWVKCHHCGWCVLNHRTYKPSLTFYVYYMTCCHFPFHWLLTGPGNRQRVGNLFFSLCESSEPDRIPERQKILSKHGNELNPVHHKVLVVMACTSTNL